MHAVAIVAQSCPMTVVSRSFTAFGANCVTFTETRPVLSTRSL